MNPVNAQIDNKRKVVIGVDDVPENLTFLKMVLLVGGYTFIGCASGAECLTLVRRVMPKLILLDIQMPDMDGFDACRKLRTMPELNSVPIAFLTACKTPEDVRAGIAAGGNDFIVKPFTREHLLERVRHWTSRRVDTKSAASAWT